MENEAYFVPGLFSEVGRTTAFEIENLQNQLNLGEKLQGTDDAHGQEKPKAHSKKDAAKGQDDLKPQTPGGELAKAIQAKLRANEAACQAKLRANKPVEHSTSKSMVVEKSERSSIPFNREGKDGNYATKFTAEYDIGFLNHRNEQKPENPYKVKHEAVLHRFPQWDFHEHGKTQPLSKPTKDPLAFMTGLDLNDEDAIQALTAHQRGTLNDIMGRKQEKPKPLGTSMSLNSERGALGNIGRSRVFAHEVSGAHDSDMLEQDIKGYPKLRYPKWDMEAPAARGPLIKADSLGEPGKYDVNLDCVKGVPKSGIGFGKALPRSVCVSTLGYIAPPAVLHPEEKRTRGQLPDRSRAKDNVRYRATHVNDFDRELARPPLLTGAAQDFHDTNDPAACEAVHQRGMNFDAATADVAVTHRRDLAPKYRHMLGRGRDAVQGLRALSTDLAVRGSVGLGFVETRSFAESTQEQRDATAFDSTKMNPNIGPKFDHRTINVHNTTTEKMQRGRPLVKGHGLDYKHAQRLKKEAKQILTNAFKRSTLTEPGFDSRSKLGGTRVLANSRSSTAIPGWAPGELDMFAEVV